MSISQLERDLLSKCISDPMSLDVALESIDPNCFSIKEYSDIWQLISSITQDGMGVSRQLIKARAQNVLSKKEITALEEVINAKPDGSIVEIIRVIKEGRFRSKVKSACKELYNRAETGNIKDVDSMITSIQSYGDIKVSGAPRSIMSPNQVTSYTMDDLNDEIQGVKTPKLSSSGIGIVDLKENNFEGHRLMILMAESGVGKTRFATQFVVSTNNLYESLNNDLGVLVFVLESGVKTWLKLIISKMGKVPTGYLKHGQWDALVKHGYEDAYNQALKDYQSSRIYLTDCVSNISSVERNVDRFEALHGVRPGLIVVDYVQLLGGDPTLGEVRQLEDVAWRLQKIADEYECQVLALSQLTVGIGGSVTPKWSRAIKENATIALRLKCENEYGSDNRVLINDKNRINMLWKKPIRIDTDLGTCTYNEHKEEANPWA